MFIVLRFDPSFCMWDSKVGKAGIQEGDDVLRIGGRDVSMLTQQQVEAMLKERPVMLKIGKPI